MEKCKSKPFLLIMLALAAAVLIMGCKKCKNGCGIQE